MTARSWLFSYIGCAFIWGFSFVLNKVALTALTPVQITTARLSLGAVTLLGLVLVTSGTPRPTWGELRHLIILGTVGLALPFTLIAFAQTRLTTILAGLLNAATPLFTGLFITFLIPHERPGRTQVAGLSLGFIGIAILIGVWNLNGAGGTDSVGVVAMIAATICYGFGTSFSRVSLSRSTLSGTQLAALQLVAGSALGLLALSVDPGEPVGALSLPAVAAVIALGVLGTGLAMVLFWHVIRQAGSTVAATVTYVVPVVSTTAGVLLVREHLGWNQVVGGVIVIAGVILTQLPQLRGRGVPDQEPAASRNE